MKIYRKILYKRRRNNCFNFFLLITLNIKEIFFCEIVEKTRFLFASLCINWNMCWNVHTRIGYIARCNSLFSSFLIVNFLSFYFYSLCKKGTKIDRILYNITLYKNVLQFCFICWAARALSFLKFIVVQNGILMLLICGRWNRMEKFWGNCQHPATFLNHMLKSERFEKRSRNNRHFSSISFFPYWSSTVVSAPAPQKMESKPATLFGKLVGRAGSAQTIVIAAHYDSSGLVPVSAC